MCRCLVRLPHQDLPRETQDKCTQLVTPRSVTAIGQRGEPDMGIFI